MWLDTLRVYTRDHFGEFSTQVKSLDRLASDFRIDAIRPTIGLEAFQKKALQYIESFTAYAEELSFEQSQPKEVKLQRPSFEEARQEYVKTASIVAKQNQTNNKTNRQENNIILPFSREALWTISLTIIGGVFLFGLYIGQAKFDKEKSDFYEENKKMKAITNRNFKESQHLKHRLSTAGDSIKFYQDSLSRVNKKLQTSLDAYYQLYLQKR